MQLSLSLSLAQVTRCHSAIEDAAIAKASFQPLQKEGTLRKTAWRGFKSMNWIFECVSVKRSKNHSYVFEAQTSIVADVSQQFPACVLVAQIVCRFSVRANRHSNCHEINVCAVMCAVGAWDMISESTRPSLFSSTSRKFAIVNGVYGQWLQANCVKLPPVNYSLLQTTFVRLSSLLFEYSSRLIANGQFNRFAQPNESPEIFKANPIIDHCIDSRKRCE